MNWDRIVFIIAGLLTIWLVAAEIQRSNKARLPWRLLATVVAIGALLAMALPLRLPPVHAPTQEKVIVLTDGFDTDTVKALYNPHTSVYAADSLAWVKGRRWNAQWMPYPENWVQAGKTIQVVGSGLAPYQLSSGSFVFHPSPTPAGVIHISWKQRLATGEALQVQGQYSRSQHKAVKLLLYGLHAPLDSQLIPAAAAADNVPFTLTARPKHSGGAVYRIIAMQGSDTLSNDPLPVFVTPADTLNVLLLAAMPDAENRFLKDWLGSHGSKVAMRTVISKARYDQGFMNRHKDALPLTAASLAHYDLVVADAAALQALPGPDLAAIAAQVEQGMGLLVKADSGQNTHAFYTQGIGLQTATAAQEQVIVWKDGQQLMAPLHTGQAVYIRPGDGVQPLHTDDKGHVMSAIHLYGRGRIVTSTLTDTYTWQLAAQADNYAQVWSQLLQKTAREKPASDAVYGETAFPLPHTPVSLFRESNHPPQDTTLAFAPNSAMPFRWQATAWPRSAGWQAIESGSPWYVYTEKDWQSLRSAARLQITEAYTRQPIRELTETNIRSNQDQGLPMPPLYFFLAFLAAAGFLWLERKL
ncbi:hypothetical protein GA0116948_11334 [Chitinophaga costaii]|uniref:Uncharacterized protein n=1 Tax=Chitinophaga costaii TaxID=1335309 RepID=A0A1C4FC87_9BACT|nr:hypothetical protein [Chitinophaga costaii]PUZ20712.1 hypothetical protein DCM91_18295 [Chitinophaga costaii]SCC53245.1 hypothetical protein GA0116948_11334 [Chitinophaga costaii]